MMMTFYTTDDFAMDLSISEIDSYKGWRINKKKQTKTSSVLFYVLFCLKFDNQYLLQVSLENIAVSTFLVIFENPVFHYFDIVFLKQLNEKT